MQRELVVRAMGGDYDAFASLVRAAAARQYAIATLILRDHELAQDAVQEALVAAWRGMAAIRDPGAWDAWLQRLVVRSCHAAARRRRRRALVELHGTVDAEPQDGTDLPSSLAERDLMERALDRLPVEQRSVLVLHFYLGMRLTDAAEVLGVPVGTAKSRLNRGLATLRHQLGAGVGVGRRIPAAASPPPAPAPASTSAPPVPSAASEGRPA